MAKHKILVSRVVHTDAGFLVFNAGETKEVPDHLVDAFRAEGNIGGGPSADDDEGDGLDSLTKAKLFELAKARDVDVESDANKATLLATLRAAGVTLVDGAASDGGVTGGGGPDAPTE